MVSLRTYSTNAASNTADFPEGMSPAAVNDECREMQAEITRYLVDQGGALATTGGTTSYALTLSTAPATLTDGLDFVFRVNATNTGASTLTVTPNGGSAFTSKKLMRIGPAGTAIDLAPGDLIATGIYTAKYNSAADGGAGAYIVLTPTDQIAVIASGTASVVGNVDLALPSGYETIEIFLTNIQPATTGGAGAFRISTNSGVSYGSGASDYATAFNFVTSAGTSAVVGGSSSQAIFTNSLLSSGPSNHFKLTIPMSPSGLVVHPITIAGSQYNSSTSQYNFISGQAVYITGGALTNIRFLSSTGTNISMNYRVIGYR